MIKFIFSNIFLLSLSVNAVIRTVSNDSNTPAKYDNIQSAMAAATNGDTIYILKSPTRYGGNTIVTKALIFIGSGHKSINEQNQNVSDIESFDLRTGCNGSKFFGLRVNNFFVNDANNIVVSRCMIYDGTINFQYSGGNVKTNWIIEGCLFKNGRIALNGSSSKNIIIRNNLFDVNSNSYINSSNDPTVIITNNLFLGNDYQISTRRLQDVDKATIANNIFYRTYVYDGNSSSNIFYNNLIMDNSHTVAGNTFQNTITTLPSFTGYSFIQSMHNQPNSYYWGFYEYILNYYDRSFFLTPGSVGINAGTDGKDIGLIKGLFNINGTPFIPQITSFNATPVINFGSPGDPINFSVKAKNKK
ncbi:MAG: hypothetical protein SFY32_00880 [Bacteroidota bacterium]|nr:hypothetical protein [Bacteroidota bacterium]